MRYKIITKLKNITHTGAHIGRDIEINISSMMGISFTAKRRVPPEQVTNLNVEIGRIISDTSSLSLPISVTITEHDAVFNDEGTSQQTIESIPPEMRVPTVDDPKWTGDFNDDNETILLARVIFGEARDGRLSDAARIAVGWSIRNRVEYKNALRYGGTYHAVILKPKQYSSFNANDANRYLVENPLANENGVDTRAWIHCYNIAVNVLNNSVTDPTSGSNHFFDDSISPPLWAKDEYFKVKIDSFLFYDIL